MKNKIAFSIIRISLGVVFLLFGIGKFKNDSWALTIKNMDFFLKLPWSVDISVFLIGLSETVTGLALIIGLFTRFFSVLAAMQLLVISVLLKFEENRDIGLLGMSVYIAIVNGDSFGVDWFWKRHKRGVL